MWSHSRRSWPSSATSLAVQRLRWRPASAFSPQRIVCQSCSTLANTWIPYHPQANQRNGGHSRTHEIARTEGCERRCRLVCFLSRCPQPAVAHRLFRLPASRLRLARELVSMLRCPPSQKAACDYKTARITNQTMRRTCMLQTFARTAFVPCRSIRRQRVQARDMGSVTPAKGTKVFSPWQTRPSLGLACQMFAKQASGSQQAEYGNSNDTHAQDKCDPLSIATLMNSQRSMRVWR